MQKFPQETVAKQWDRLPMPLREALFNPNLGTIVENTAATYNFSDEQAENLRDIVSGILFCFIHRNNLKSLIASELQLSPETSETIALHLQKNILDPLAAELDKNFSALNLSPTDALAQKIADKKQIERQEKLVPEFQKPLAHSVTPEKEAVVDELLKNLLQKTTRVPSQKSTPLQPPVIEPAPIAPLSEEINSVPKIIAQKSVEPALASPSKFAPPAIEPFPKTSAEPAKNNMINSAEQGSKLTESPTQPPIPPAPQPMQTREPAPVAPQAPAMEAPEAKPVMAQPEIPSTETEAQSEPSLEDMLMPASEINLHDTNPEANSAATIAPSMPIVEPKKEIPLRNDSETTARPFILHQETNNAESAIRPSFASYQAVRPTYYKTPFEETVSEDGRQPIIAARIQFNEDDEEAITVKEPEKAHTVIGEAKIVHYAEAQKADNPFEKQETPKIPLKINTNPQTANDVHPDNIINLKNK